MRDRRFQRGFRPLGGVDPGRAAGLSAARVRDLRLQRAWLDVAGEALAQRVQAVRVSRGVLELAVDDPRWARELRALIPRLAVRLARADADLGIRKFRILGAPEAERARPLPDDDGPPDDERAGAGPDVGESADSGDSRSRADRGAPDIEELARRYLGMR